MHAWHGRFFSRFIPVAVAVTLALAGCSETSTHPDDDDHDIVTTIRLDVTDTLGNAVRSWTWEDADGPGGAAPNRIDTIVLSTNAPYLCSVHVLNVLAEPDEDLTPVIVSEGIHHQFFYASTLTGIVVTYNDKDANGRPIGQRIRLSASEAGKGLFIIELSHFDDAANKNGVDPSDETDVRVEFPLHIQ
jgi:hypothetical protein